MQDHLRVLELLYCNIALTGIVDSSLRARGNMFKGCCHSNLSPKDFFLQGSRLAFGFWLAYVGIMKWLGGPAGVVEHIAGDFSKTWSPSILNTALGWLIVVAEPLLGLWLLSGIRQKCAWTATALLMFLLTFGMTMLGKYDVVGANFHYFFLCLACAAWTEKSASSCG